VRAGAEAIHQILADEDQMRREYGPQFVERRRSMTQDSGADFTFATSDLPMP
jgi:hypothetical protein